MTPWLVVPTLGNRDHSLTPLLRDAGMPSVVVWTGEREAWMNDGPYQDGNVLFDRVQNIQRWWNLGIQNAVDNGADVVVVCNDDVAADPGALLELASCIELDDPAASMLVWPDDPEHASTRVTAITGWCFALDPARIRPDEAFAWWYGDHDLELRARAMNPWGGALAVKNPGIKHLRTDWSYDRPVGHLTEVDRALFTRRYPALMGGWK